VGPEQYTPFSQHHHSIFPPARCVRPRRRVCQWSCRIDSEGNAGEQDVQVRKEPNKTARFYGDVIDKSQMRSVDRVFQVLEAAVVAVTGGPRGRNESPWLQGNFGPVAYEVEGECELVLGALPEELHGAYMRNGYNSALRPLYDYHHFEADGMIHCVRLGGDKVRYGNRFVRTKRFELETKVGRPMMVRISDLTGIRGLMTLALRQVQCMMGIIPGSGMITKGYGTGNTSIILQGDKLYALQEGDAPFEIRGLCSGAVETIRVAEELVEGMPGASSHPKYDQKNGYLYSFGYQVPQKPYVTIGRYREDGSLERTVPLMTVQNPTLMHDFAMTENYIVIMETALQFDFKNMVVNNDNAITLNKNAPTRFGILGKNDTDESKLTWVELPESCWISHVANAAEVDGCIQVDAIHYSDLDFNAPNGEEFISERNLCRWMINLETGVAERATLSLDGLRPEFPVINPLYACDADYKWSWMLLVDDLANPPKFSSVAKMDMNTAARDRQRGIVASIKFGHETYGNELIFVPRFQEPERCISEDDGYLMGFINDEANGDHTSYFVVYDALTMDQTPVCKYRLPQRVPYGLHGIFINESQFQQQLGITSPPA